MVTNGELPDTFNFDGFHGINSYITQLRRYLGVKLQQRWHFANVVRLDVSIGSSTVTVTNVTEIAHGYAFGLNAAAFVVGPSGLAYDEEEDILYVASTADNEIFKFLHAEATNISVLKGILVYNDPTHLQFSIISHN